MAQPFNDERIVHLTVNHNWELAYSDDGKYHLRQKDKHYMKTVDFKLPENVAKKYLRESDSEYCENGHDNTKLIDNCVQCGAPVCCPDCCNEEYESRGA